MLTPLICTMRLLTPFLLLLAVLAPEVRGENTPIVSPEQAAQDLDFLDAGEYLGSIATGPGRSVRLGLQVSALGSGQFRAAMHRGGLPGSGWDGDLRSELAGARDGANGAILLRSQQHLGVFELHNGECVVRDEKGAAIGRLRQVIRRSPTEGLIAPKDAVVLFDGEPHHLSSANLTSEDLLDVGFSTEEPFGDFRMHLEFRTPYMPYAQGQARGNSGVYIQQRYETQILDSFSLRGAENECGGLYRQRRPDINMAFPPLTWQTYDLFFQAAQFDEDGKKTKNARITLFHNGVAVHSDVELPTKTGAGKPEGPQPLPTHFQNHRDPVRFRNLWIVPGSEAARREFVVHSGPIVENAPPRLEELPIDLPPVEEEATPPVPTESTPNDEPSPSDLPPPSQPTPAPKKELAVNEPTVEAPAEKEPTVEALAEDEPPAVESTEVEPAEVEPAAIEPAAIEPAVATKPKGLVQSLLSGSNQHLIDNEQVHISEDSADLSNVAPLSRILPSTKGSEQSRVNSQPSEAQTESNRKK